MNHNTDNTTLPGDYLEGLTTPKAWCEMRGSLCAERARAACRLIFCSGLALLAFSTCVTTALADREQEQQFIWNQANSRMSSARTADDFLEAAQIYRKLVDRGVRNGPLLYNMGTALLLAEQYEQALAALLQAERYTGYDPEIRRNMLIAISGTSSTGPARLPWFRVFLFWHYNLAGSIRTGITVLAFACFWFALVIRCAGRNRASKRLLLLSSLIFVLFGSSIATTLHMESRSRQKALIANRLFSPITPDIGEPE